MAKTPLPELQRKGRLREASSHRTASPFAGPSRARTGSSPDGPGSAHVSTLLTPQSHFNGAFAVEYAGQKQLAWKPSLPLGKQPPTGFAYAINANERRDPGVDRKELEDVPGLPEGTAELP